ncbi:MAG TPA: methyltransferase domain-containing protein [Nanoarchaeota archaeon]|nr:methyltransferase domain-containing protein [Candidatus Pacearchaeota archaeon]HIH18292.1 methyltransferase domain-containing protein [Nanoarchaeota archaeon]HIH34162.1 methyltransferase domain-containing protein [Nanoarchaeota archaeon]HIH51262.1 methyltransferase domain-containing protein [Nanoarchaeota archaeon]HIH65769.1 methyltransferase domain-containing protein [Nanoarchaeota archaeon]
MYILFPGRHHVLTRFQQSYLEKARLGESAGEGIEAIIFAVTSANHSGTRRNPVPAYLRAAEIELFSDRFRTRSFTYLVDDIGASERFADYLVKSVEVQSDGKFSLSPENTLVACSTPEVIKQFEGLGYKILPVELDRKTGKFTATRPWDLVNLIAEKGGNWKEDPQIRGNLSDASLFILDKYGIDKKIQELHRDPILGENGDLTETRDYNTYVRAFDEGAERKAGLVRSSVLPGRIVDIGCCTGSLLRELALEDRLRESDFYGVEIARELVDICQHRKQHGHFANDNVFFYQRNATTGKIFADNSVNTFITTSLTHEIESYQGRDSLENFFGLVYQQLSPGGRWINFDVVGPEDKERKVYMKLNEDDGTSDWFGKFTGDARKDLKLALDNLSTYGRFFLFADEFRKDTGDQIQFEIVHANGSPLVRLRLEDAAEFLSKKDYTDNWQSEMHERFCFWDFDEWKDAAEKAGFVTRPESHAFRNEWIVENRYKGKAELFDENMNPIEYPVTNMLLAAEKPRS